MTEKHMRHRYFTKKHGLNPEQAAGIVGNLYQESSMNPAHGNPGDGSDGTAALAWASGTAAEPAHCIVSPKAKAAMWATASPSMISSCMNWLGLRTPRTSGYWRLRAQMKPREHSWV